MEKRPLKILFVTALPRRDLGSPHPDFANDEEFRRLHQQIQDSGQKDRVTLVPLFAARIEDLARELVAEEPEIVHFATHGNEDGSLLLNDGEGGAAPLTPAALLELLRPVQSLICVVLNACWSERAMAQLSTLPTAPYLIGMPKPIKDSAALAFADGFYLMLLNGASLRQSFSIGVTFIGQRDGGIADDAKPKEFPKEDTSVSTKKLLPRPDAQSPIEKILRSTLPTRASMRQFLAQIFLSVPALDAFCQRRIPAAVSALGAAASREERIDQLLRRQHTSTILLALLDDIDSDSGLRRQFVVHHALLHYIPHAEYQAEIATAERAARRAGLRAAIRRFMIVVSASLSILTIGCFALTHHFDRPRELPPDDKEPHRYKDVFVKKLSRWAGIKQSALNHVLVQTAHVHGSTSQNKIFFELRVEWKKREYKSRDSDETWLHRTYQGVIHYEATYSALQEGMPVRMELSQIHYSFLPVSPGPAHFLGFIDLFVMTRQHDNDLQENLLRCLQSPGDDRCPE